MKIKDILNAYAQEGFDVTDVNDEMEISNYIQENAEKCPIELYRGIMVDNDYEIEIGDSVEFDNLFASFDEDIEKAKDFATRLSYGVVFILRDPEGLPLYMHANTCHDEQEWLIMNYPYTVINIEKEDVWYVTIKQK